MGKESDLQLAVPLQEQEPAGAHGEPGFTCSLNTSEAATRAASENPRWRSAAGFGLERVTALLGGVGRRVPRGDRAARTCA